MSDEPRPHALLSPSSAERWISCPASVLDIEALPPREEQISPYAVEGTIAHSLAEIRASLLFSLTTKAAATKSLRAWRKENDVDATSENEMWRYVEIWLDVLKDYHGRAPNSRIFLEQRLDSGVPGVWGTTDCAIVGGDGKNLYVLDFKYGAGVAVDAENNAQLRLYALGALDEHDVIGTVEKVTMVIVQPRIGNGYVGEEVLTVEDLRAWRDEVSLIAEVAVLPDAPYGPSEKACRWCPMSGQCQAQIAAVFEEVDFEKEPTELSPLEVAEILGALPRIKDWITAFETSSLHRAYDKDEHIPGWKVVMSGGKRGCVNEEAALKHLEELGHNLDDVTTRKIMTIGGLEALLGKKAFTDELGLYFPKSPGKPSLVPEDDSRPALHRDAEAAAIFGDDDVI